MIFVSKISTESLIFTMNFHVKNLLNKNESFVKRRFNKRVNEFHVNRSFFKQFFFIIFNSFIDLSGKAKICCTKCQKKCSGEVLRVTDKYFHKQCFQCSACKKSLAAGGFFSKDGSFYCTLDYQRLFGTKCAACKQYVEGEVVSTMGNTYHQKCFTCSRCNKPFQSGSKVSETEMVKICYHFGECHLISS